MSSVRSGGRHSLLCIGIVNIFGVNRCMVGSNFPVDKMLFLRRNIQRIRPHHAVAVDN